MKKLLTFSVPKEIEIEETQITKAADGKEIKALVKVKKNETHNYFLARPNRTVSEKAELEYQKVFWACQKEGILPMSQLSKRINDDGGVLTEAEVKWRADAYDKFFTLRTEQQTLNEKKDKTDDDNKKLNDLMIEIVDIYSKIQELEQDKVGNLQQNTAESIAKNRQSLFWTMFLSYEDLGDEKYVPVFGSGTYEERLKVYDDFEEKDDDFINKVIQRLFLAASLWNLNKVQNQEDFDISLKSAEQQGLISAIEVITKLTEEKEVKETPKEDGKESIVAE